MNKTTSLELSQRLNKLVEGVESLFYWDVVAGGEKEVVVNHGFMKNITNNPNCHEELSIDCVPAYTLAELWELMPDGRDYSVRLIKAINGYHCELKSYKVMPYDRVHIILSQDSPTEALGLMYEYILTNEIK